MLGNKQELAAKFERQLQDLARAWRDRGVDTRGIASGSLPGHEKVAGWINAPGSRPRFDEVAQKLGRDWTVEALTTHQEFRPLFEGMAGVLAKAEARLSGAILD